MIKYLGPNVPKYYLLCWKVKDHYLNLERTLMGGLFLRVRNEAEEIVVDYWPTTYQRTVILMQLNYLADQILKGNAAQIKQFKPKHHFVNKWHDADFNDETQKQEYLDAVVQWVNNTWGEMLDPWQDNYPHIPEFPDAAAVRAFNEITPVILDDLKNKKGDQYKGKKDENNTFSSADLLAKAKGPRRGKVSKQKDHWEDAD